MAKGRIDGWPRMWILGVGGFLTGVAVFWAAPLSGDLRRFGLRERIELHPATYQLPAIPGGTSLRMAMIHDVLVERYLRHGEAWYAMRIEESRKAMEEEKVKGVTTRRLEAMDDLAVGLENLHKSDEAAEVMREKLKLLPAMTVNVPARDEVEIILAEKPEGRIGKLEQIKAAATMPAQMRAQYTARANLGTFLIHGNFKQAAAGDAAAQGRIGEGLKFIQEQIVINPGAHFGRETWQAIVVQHFLACWKKPELMTRYDMIGDDLAVLSTKEWVQKASVHERGLNFPAKYFDEKSADEKRVLERMYGVTTVAISRNWVEEVKPNAMSPVAFDEPALGLMGMWVLGGGANPNSAMALGNIALQVGQLEIAWDGFERAQELAAGWGDVKIRTALVDYCKGRQEAIAKAEDAEAVSTWTEKTRKRHVQELAWGKQYQADYQAWEAKQIAAGVGLDEAGFYDGFFEGRAGIASPVGHVDEVETHIHSPDGPVDGLPGGFLVAGVSMLAGALTAKRRA